MNETELKAGLPETANYRYAERVGNQLFIAGQVPQDENGMIVGESDPGEQAQKCLQNLRSLLTLHGFSETDIRRLVVYVIGEQENLDAAWASVANWFENDVPPATLLGVASLGYADQLVEIDATIVKETKDSK